MVASIAVAIAACSPVDMAESMGAWIEVPLPTTEPTTTTTTTTTLPAPVPVGDLVWSNDEFGVQTDQSSAGAVRAVADRARTTDKMIQASRFEISLALPGLMFPSILPVGVTHVSSQLILDQNRLSEEEVAAFGFWLVEPYTQSRTVGQAGTFFVERRGAVPPSCSTNAQGDVCSEFETNVGIVLQIQQADGAVWVWEIGDYRYRLFLRVVDPTLASEMIETAAPLRNLISEELEALGVPPLEEPSE